MTKKNWVPKFSTAVLLLASLVAIGFGARSLSLGTVESEAMAAPKGAVTDNLRDLFVELSKRLVPSVVNIYTTQTVQNQYGGPQAELYRRFFEQFFGEDYGGQGGGGLPQGPQTRKATSLGSGFIIDEKEGLILTNYHVVADADEVKVILTEEDADQEGVDAKIVGGDAEADVALIKIKTNRKLVPAALGDSDSLEVGEWVMAVGNPFGHGHTVTKGIISAKQRVVPISQFANYLQTDTPINPGNSGGPLINTAGEVIGINTAINAAAQGIGFAIPINYVKRILPELRTKGAVTRGFIGVNISELNPKLAAGMKLPKNTRGVVVSEVIQGEPAAKAGLQRYDVITSINDKPIIDGRQLVNTVSTFAPGATISVRVLRNGKERELKVLVGKRPTREKLTQTSPGKLIKPRINVGMQVSELDDETRKELGFPASLRGVIVDSIQPGGPAEEAGLEPRDVIVEVDQKPVSSLRSFSAVFREPRIYLVSFRRGGEGVAITSLDLSKKAGRNSGGEDDEE